MLKLCNHNLSLNDRECLCVADVLWDPISVIILTMDHSHARPDFQWDIDKPAKLDITVPSSLYVHMGPSKLAPTQSVFPFCV